MDKEKGLCTINFVKNEKQSCLKINDVTIVPREILREGDSSANWAIEIKDILDTLPKEEILNYCNGPFIKENAMVHDDLFKALYWYYSLADKRSRIEEQAYIALREKDARRRVKVVTNNEGEHNEKECNEEAY